MRRTKAQREHDIETQTKVCTKCSKRKPFDEFANRKDRADGKNYVCKPCDFKRRKGYYDSKPARHKHSAKMSFVKRTYGLTEDDWMHIMNRQQGQCAICEESLCHPDSNDNPFALDHNHETGEVRGMLCSRCNIMLGMAKDNPMVLIRAAHYLSTN